MIRKLVFAILFTSLIGHVVDVSAGNGQGHVVYVQIGDSWLKVDLESQRFENLLGPPKSAINTRVHVVKRDDDAMNVESFASWQECGRDIQWRPLPSQSVPIGLDDAFLIVRGVLIDTKRALYLSGVCPGVITSAVAYENVLLFSRREVDVGSIPGYFFFPGREIVARSGADGSSPSDIYKFKGGVSALSIDPLTGDALVVREVSRVVLVGGLLRALAGHPRQISEYDLVVIDKSARLRKIIKLGSRESPLVVNIVF